MYGGFAGTETDRSERDPETNVTVVSGDIQGDARSAVLFTGANSARLDGLTISGADIGLSEDYTSTRIEGCIFADNGIGVVLERSDTTMDDSHFRENDQALRAAAGLNQDRGEVALNRG